MSTGRTGHGRIPSRSLFFSFAVCELTLCFPVPPGHCISGSGVPELIVPVKIDRDASSELRHKEAAQSRQRGQSALDTLSQSAAERQSPGLSISAAAAVSLAKTSRSASPRTSPRATRPLAS
jgi:hypothetical protein